MIVTSFLREYIDQVMIDSKFYVILEKNIKSSIKGIEEKELNTELYVNIIYNTLYDNDYYIKYISKDLIIDLINDYLLDEEDYIVDILS